MFITVEFPVFDGRGILATRGGRLSVPSWPSPEPISEFVRGLGPIDYRRRGGIEGWTAEHRICRADQIFKATSEWNKQIPSLEARPKRILFRRFNFDGHVSGKFSLGLNIPDVYPACVGLGQEHVYGKEPQYEYDRPLSKMEMRPLEYKQIISAVEHILRLKFSIGKNAEPLWDSGKNLKKIYCRATTATGAPSADDYVTVGWPAVYVELAPLLIDVGSEGLDDNLIADLGWGQLFAQPIFVNRGRVILWLMVMNRREEKNRGRNLRMSLLRAFSEVNNLQELFYFISKNAKLLPDRQHWASTFQNYLTEKLNFLAGASKRELDQQVLGILRNKVEAGHILSIIEQFESVGFRPQLVKRAEAAANIIFFAKEVVVGDKLQAGQGSVVAGRNSTLSGQIHTEVNIAESNLNLPQLHQELTAIRELAESRASSGTEKKDVSLLKEAEKEASSGSLPSTLSLLKKCGKWVLDIGKEIGAKIVTSIIEKQLGI